MLQVFRIEHEATRLGPFQTPDEFTQDLAQRANALPWLKAPGEDGLPRPSDLPFCFVFGCTDLPALRQWFCLGESGAENASIVQSLKQRGFRLVEFLVERDDCLFSLSGNQVAFNPGFSRDEGLTQVHELESLL